MFNHDNAPNASKIWDAAAFLRDKLSHRAGSNTEYTAVWNDYRHRSIGIADAELASACLRHFKTMQDDFDAREATAREAHLAREAAGMRAGNSVSDRRAWAATGLKSLNEFAAKLRRIAGEIDEANGVQPPSIYMGPATAPIGNPEELASFIESFEPALRKAIDDGLADIHANLAISA